MVEEHVEQSGWYECGRGFSATAVFAAALCALPSSSPAESIPVDLNLDRAPTHELRMEPRPNPHDRFPCAGCHEHTDLTYEMAVKYGVEVPLITEGDSSILLCEECHREGQHSFHPVNFPVERLYEIVRAQGVFPLETIVEGFNKLTCITCHDVHFPHTGNRLLRGFPLVADSEAVSFRDRVDFCSSCHGREEIVALSSHRERTPDDRCNLCHLGYRQPGVPGPLTRHLNRSCVICHPLPGSGRPHFYNYNPFPDFKRTELQDYGLSLEKGGFTCNTCHKHHRQGDDEALLRPGFITLVSKSARVNPHRTTRFCLNCHPFQPEPLGTPGAVAPLWEEDTTRLCRRCHGREGTLTMDHPLTVPSEPGMVPINWELRKDGSLGCQTCHNGGHGPYDPANPKLLRGGYYNGRNGICFVCHRREDYENRNIHYELEEEGNCEFCHVIRDRTALLPEGKVGDTLAEPMFLCLICHDPPPHPASTDHTGRPGTRSFVTMNEKTAPLTLGKVTCHTCHDSHSTDTDNRLLRTQGSRSMVCANCHPF